MTLVANTVPRALILALALFQSLVLLLLHQGIEADWPAFSGGAFRVTAYTLTVAVPAMLMLLIRGPRDGFSWRCALGLLVLLPWLGLHSGAACGTIGDCENVLVPYGLSLGIALFILSPFLQNWRDGRSLHYPSLFEHAWDNALTLSAAAVFTGLGWAIFGLAAALFKVVGIGWLQEMIQSRLFAYPASGLLVGLGVSVARTMPGATRESLRVSFSLCRLLLPVLALLALTFAGVLPFTGLAPLWKTGQATFLLLALTLGLISLTNAVVEDLREPAQAGRLTRVLLTGALCVLPLYAGLAVYGLSLRVGQHGWSVDRCYAAIVCATALLHALTYALAALRRGPLWLAGIARANILAAALLVPTLLLAQSPLLNFRALSAASQIARAETGALAYDKLDLKYLRWELGQEGVDALRGLLEHEAVRRDEKLTARIQELLARPIRSAGPRPRLAILVADDFLLKPDGASPPPELMQAINTIEGETYALETCQENEPHCLLIRADLNADGQEEWALINPQRHCSGGCWPVLALQAGQWRVVAHVHSDGGMSSSWTTDELRVLPQVWQDLAIGENRLRVVPK